MGNFLHLSIVSAALDAHDLGAVLEGRLRQPRERPREVTQHLQLVDGLQEGALGGGPHRLPDEICKIRQESILDL